MNIALLTCAPQSYATQRLLQEALALRLNCELVNPKDFLIQSGTAQRFTFSLNRIALVDVNAFTNTLLDLPCWGRQLNSQHLRLMWGNKAQQLLWLERQAFPVIPFMLLQGSPHGRARLESWLDTHNSTSGWVMKMNRGQRGVGVHFIQDQVSLRSWLETFWRMGDQDFIIQPKVPVKREWRVSLIGAAWQSVLLRSHSQGKANAHGDQQVEWVTQVPQALEELLEKFKRSVSFDFVALDILEDESGLYINDINTTMGFEQLEKITSYNVARLMLEHSIKASH